MKKILIAVMSLLCVLPVCAQEIYTPDDAPPMLPVYGSSVVEEGMDEGLPIPVAYEGSGITTNWDSPASYSFAESVRGDVRNRFGFTLGANEGYITNVYPESPDRESTSSTLTSLSGSVFANFGERKSVLHLDYGINYSFYNDQDFSVQDFGNGADHNATVYYTYTPNEKSRFLVMDRFSSSTNDMFGGLDFFSLSTVDWMPQSYSVHFLPQRVHRNDISGSYERSIARRTRINVFGSYNSYWYDHQDFGGVLYDNINAAQVGAGVSQGITDWLSLSSSYSVYLNNVPEELQGQQIHRVEVGGLHFKLAPTVEVYASGGLEIAEIDDDYQMHEMVSVGISKRAGTGVLYANYSRSMSTPLGYWRILPSDSVSIGYGQRITDRANFRLMGAYRRSHDYDADGLLRNYYGSASFEYSLTRNLFASANYAYQYQNNSINIPAFVSSIPRYDRSMIFAGLQYAWPALREGE
ncbi:MAG: hypothetical protein LBT74_00140 [Acidobacteriota bacterium]|jgi:hypothetical protein|nr:hypothetical protein [Acidobacteriota bacterium]